MYKLTISSKKYPAIQVPVPDLPGKDGAAPTLSNSEKPTMVTWYRGLTYQLTNRSRLAFEKAFSQFEERIKRHYTLQWTHVAGTEALEAGSGKPSDVSQNQSGEGDTETPEKPVRLSLEEINAKIRHLSEDDLDLVSVEVSKLIGRTIAEATPIVTATAENPDLNIVLRAAYLQEVIDHEDTQKGLKEEAQELLEKMFEASPEPEA